MLKKFRDWLTSGVSTVSISETIPKTKVSHRIQLSQSHLILGDGAMFETAIGEDRDVETLLAIQTACYNGETPWNASALHHELKRNTNALYIVIRQISKPVAFIGAWLVEKEAHITNVAVVPEFQRKGIATWMIQELERISAAEGMEVLSLEVRVSNEKAQRLYHQLGFSEGKVKKFYYSNDHEDALEMSKQLVKSEVASLER
ncbi:ribosomal protein S18-alanine N-acetyltransferase [Desemzia sp. FAM 24101]|uniref:ribosomal protein S18-alanine N-acetyltransferase n=1 Tax=unclassified Desemzia TaxID=2685243 RepID=UPI003887AE6D